AESGYLTRKLVDVAQDIIIREEDCGTRGGIILSRDDKRMMDFSMRIIGRFSSDDIINEKTGEVIIKKGEEITEDVVKFIDEAKISEVKVRSALTCEAKEGICQKC
ncbi:MAG: DNA-directed RNA polymerase subunit beta', partial [candidate division WS6 bacterium GW2011_GWA2_37_6]